MNAINTVKKHVLERISGNYLNLSKDEGDLNLSDAFSLGILLTDEILKKERKQNIIDYYKAAYSSVCGAMRISNPDIFLIRLANLHQTETWDDFSDFNSVWYPKWFANQIGLRANILSFANQEEEQKIKPDFWGSTCSDEKVKMNLLHIRDSFKQVKIETLSLIFKIDKALASLLGWENISMTISWSNLREKFSYPIFKNF